MIHLTWSWTCQDCDEHGDGPKSDLASRKHEAATQHSTVVRGVPA